MKRPEQMKYMVEDWIKITGLKYQDTTTQMQEKNPEIQWQILVGQSMHITKMKKRDDRILIHLALGFAEDLIDRLPKLGDLARLELFNSVNEPIPLSG